MSIRTRECNISELNAEARAVVNSLLAEEPLHCYETRITGFLGSTFYVIITKSEIVKLSGFFTSLYLKNIIGFDERTDGDGHPELTIYVSNHVMMLPFETKQILYTFTYKLRQAISTAKSKVL